MEAYNKLKHEPLLTHTYLNNQLDLWEDNHKEHISLSKIVYEGKKKEINKISNEIVHVKIRTTSEKIDFNLIVK